MAYFYKPPSDGTSAAFIASHYQLVILTHADEAYARTLRHAGYAGPLLQYIDPNQAEGPGPYRDHTAPCDRAYPTYQRTVVDRVGVFCAAVHPHERWFLHNRDGARLYTRYRSANGVWRTTYFMNPASAGWRRFLLRRMRQYRGSRRFDGFFLDNVDLSRDGLLLQPANHGGLAEYADDASYRRAVVGELGAIRRAFASLPLWANLVHDPNQAGVWQAYLPLLDGVMVEDAGLGWRTAPLTASEQRAQWSNIRLALDGGKHLLLVVQGGRNDDARRRFGLALYWALAAMYGAPAPAARRRLYFRYHDADASDYRSVWWSHDFDFVPPAPVGPLACDAARCRLPYPHGALQFAWGTDRLRTPPGWWPPTQP